MHISRSFQAKCNKKKLSKNKLHFVLSLFKVLFRVSFNAEYKTIFRTIDAYKVIYKHLDIFSYWWCFTKLENSFFFIHQKLALFYTSLQLKSLIYKFLIFLPYFYKFFGYYSKNTFFCIFIFILKFLLCFFIFYF